MRESPIPRTCGPSFGRSLIAKNGLKVARGGIRIEDPGIQPGVEDRSLNRSERDDAGKQDGSGAHLG